MLLSSVIIILREVLEAALLISVLLALSKQLNIRSHWIRWSALAGLIGAVLYGMNFSFVSEWFEDVGQEVVNALLQFGIFLSLMIIIYFIVQAFKQSNKSSCIIGIMMGLILSLAIIREGSEILIYLYNFIHSSEQLPIVLSGAFIGAGIGCSTGIICYFFLCNLMPKWSFKISMALLILIGAGMVSQASSQLIQADWLPSQLPLWDSGGFISEYSVTGQLLYAVLGYESTPTPNQASLYFGGLIILILIYILTSRVENKKLKFISMKD